MNDGECQFVIVDVSRGTLQTPRQYELAYFPMRNRGHNCPLRVMEIKLHFSRDAHWAREARTSK